MVKTALIQKSTNPSLQSSNKKLKLIVCNKKWHRQFKIRKSNRYVLKTSLTRSGHRFPSHKTNPGEIWLNKEVRVQQPRHYLQLDW